MGTNQTPHFQPSEYSKYRSGGSLKDGWSYLIPDDQFVSHLEVSVAFADEEMEDHIREQAQALKSLYLTSKEPLPISTKFQVEQEDEGRGKLHFVVKRGLQVVGVATYNESTGQLYDVAVRPSAAAGDEIARSLINAVKSHAQRIGRSQSLIVHPRSVETQPFFEAMGFLELEDEDDDITTMEAKIN